MDDPDDSASDVSETVLAPFDEDELPNLPADVVEDLTTGSGSDELSDEVSLASLSLTEGAPVIKPYPYQVEMVEESLRKNIIVAMDTGSGKTQVAVMRIQYELERMLPDQLIWFLAPTVSLCSQQFENIESQISSVQVKFLSGADGVDRWTDQKLWDGVLNNVKVVVSTYQILMDALTHAFVKMESLALIVFDEAHNTVGKQAGAKLMQNFYHQRKAQGLAVPHILGLTASPVMRSDPSSVTKIEETLDAICRTPKKHREEFRLRVKLPVFSQVSHQPAAPENSLGEYKTIASLASVFRAMNIREDPYVISLIAENTDGSQRKLNKIMYNHKTWCHDQVKSLYATTMKLCGELGAWAADYYVSEVVTKVLKSAEQSDTNMGIWDVTSAEKQYLAKTLKEVEVSHPTGSLPKSLPLVTDKITKLIEILVQRSKSATFSSIVFVQERALAAVLAHLLSVHPDTRDLFRIGAIVGTSLHSLRARNIGDLVDLNSQKNFLSLFKSGKLNLVIATSVLEEGIDVPSCNLVVCFHKPANLKSFVQRRGRARHKESELILLLDSEQDKTTEWQSLELAMRKIYEDDMRTLQEMLAQEDTDESDNRCFIVDSTGAMLDLDNAVAHLYYFCATLPTAQYVDLRPDFICSEDAAGLVRATVILPLSVDEKVRTATSRTVWESEKNAIRDAAFEAYVALYKAGLVNDNLLPLRHDEVTDELTSSTVEKRASIVKVRNQLNPWVNIARAWETVDNPGFELHQATITVGDLGIQTYLPIAMPEITPFTLYWDAETDIWVKFKSVIPDSGGLKKSWGDTWSLFKAAFGNRFPIEQKRVVMPFSTGIDISVMVEMGCHPFSTNSQVSHRSGPAAAVDTSNRGLIRNKLDGKTFVYRDYLPDKPPFGDVQNPYENYTAMDGPHLSLARVPRRFDFLHQILQARPLSSKKYSIVLPIERCTEDKLPFRFVQFGLLVPSIMHRVGVYFIAKELAATILRGLNISDPSLVVTAISASVANEETNYQRLEFLGDSVLKLCTSVQLMGIYPLWHEGYLSAKKDRLIANSRLSRAAVDIGLDAFIITKKFKGHKWRPLYNEDLLKLSLDGPREISTKVLADVVEALIGAAMVDGGIPKALRCLQIFLPELQWQALGQRQASLFERAPEYELSVTLRPLEQLIGYEFQKKSLLIEAMTHASYRSGSQSLERFEFLGDAVLDYIIVAAMYGQEVELSHIQMHHLRTSLVNADILAFMCMEWSIEQEVIDLVEDSSDLDEEGRPRFKENITKVAWPLFRFLRHMSPILGSVQHSTAARHTSLRIPILSALENGTHYPWALLARLQAQKLFSDMVESLLGAVWIDSGSFETCTAIVERMGILPYFRRILRDDVHILHPKEELGVLADAESVRYVISEREREGGEGKEYLCTVFVGDVQIVEVDDGVNKEEVKTKAAEMAVKILKETRSRAKSQGEVDESVPQTKMGVAMMEG